MGLVGGRILCDRDLSLAMVKGPQGVSAAKRALRRLLWRNVADGDECSCYPGDECDLCQATKALGFGRWTSPQDIWKKLVGFRAKRGA